MSKRSTRAFILEMWFSIDRIFFDKPARLALENKTQYNEYIGQKAAFLSNLYEVYEKMKFPIKETNYKNIAEIAVSAKKLSEGIVQSSKDLIQKENISKLVREEIQELSATSELSETEVAHWIITKRLKSLALDELAFNYSMGQDKSKICTKCLEDWHGKVLKNSHTMLRDSLIETAIL